MQDEGYALTLKGLIRRRSHLIAEINGKRDALNELMVNLQTLEEAIRVFKPDIDWEDLPERRVPPPHVAFRGELARFLVDHLRKHRGKPTTKELALAVMEARRLNTADAKLHYMLSIRVGQSLRRLRDKGYVASERADPTGKQGGLQRWWMAKRVHEEARAVTG